MNKEPILEIAALLEANEPLCWKLMNRFLTKARSLVSICPV